MSEQREDMTERDDLPGEVPAAADDAAGSVGAEESAAPTGKYGKLLSEEGGVRKLTGMYRNWFLDYASYVILERAVPHVQDGLKPVQRRILHAMKAVDDGRYNKVANIVGQTMQYHPHGDASIKDALVQLGQKDLLIDCQGNWATSSPATKPLRAVTSKPACRNSPSTWFSTRRRPSGCAPTTAVTRSR